MNYTFLENLTANNVDVIIAERVTFNPEYAFGVEVLPDFRIWKFFW